MTSKFARRISHIYPTFIPPHQEFGHRFGFQHISAPFVPAASHRGEHRHPAILELRLATTAEGLQIAVLVESGRDRDTAAGSMAIPQN